MQSGICYFLTCTSQHSFGCNQIPIRSQRGPRRIRECGAGDFDDVVGDDDDRTLYEYNLVGYAKPSYNIVMSAYMYQ